MKIGKSLILKETVHERKSPLAFSNKKIEEKDLLDLFDAARWSASAFNEQPWRFIYASKHENLDGYNTLLQLLVPSNQIWAKEAPVLILVSAKAKYSHNGKENKHAWYDTGQAIGILSLMATSKGIGLHQMAGFDAEKANEKFGIEGEFAPIAVIAVGYPGDLDSLPEPLMERALKPRLRKETNEIAFNAGSAVRLLNV